MKGRRGGKVGGKREGEEENREMKHRLGSWILVKKCTQGLALKSLRKEEWKVLLRGAVLKWRNGGTGGVVCLHQALGSSGAPWRSPCFAVSIQGCFTSAEKTIFENICCYLSTAAGITEDWRTNSNKGREKDWLSSWKPLKPKGAASMVGSPPKSSTAPLRLFHFHLFVVCDLWDVLRFVWQWVRMSKDGGTRGSSWWTQILVFAASLGRNIP